ncbi:MAG: hypothetical protein R3Y39_01950 [Rikenellaceae bacterium]
MRSIKTIAAVAISAILLSCSSTASDPIESFTNSFATPNNEIGYKGDAKFTRTIYVDPTNGDDNNSGESPNEAIKGLQKLEELSISGGDQILLKGGEKHYGTIELIGLNQGENSSTIHIGSYGEQKATLDFKGYSAGVLIDRSSNVIVTDLNITANGTIPGEEYMIRPQDRNNDYRYAVFVHANGEKVRDITIENINVSDVYYYNVDDENTPTDIRPCRMWSTNGESLYGWGIRAFSRTEGSQIDNLTVRNCHVTNVSHTGIKINGDPWSPINNLLIEDCSTINIGGPGTQFSGIRNSVMRRTKVVNPGCRDDIRMWGRGSGMWLVRSINFLFEKNYFEGSRGIADCCGAHIDIGNKDVVIQYSVSKNNCGGFVEILGENQNCCYRYNISINDGWRNRDDNEQDSYWMWRQKEIDKDGKEIEKLIGTNGCLVTVNGHSNNGYVGPYQNYIYNNTIICTDSRSDNYTNGHFFEIATSATGVSVMNNIFYVPVQMRATKSSHWVDEDGVVHNRAFDFMTTDGELDENGEPIVRDLTSAELAELDFVVDNNLYKLYDPNFAYGENALPINAERPESKNDYKDTNPLGGDPGFRGAIAETMTAEDLIPTNKAVINRGKDVPKLASDKSDYGVLPQLKMERDFFGRVITQPILGACVAE